MSNAKLMGDYNIYIFSADAKPKDGGVAEFTHQIAKALHELNRLGAAVTPQHQTNPLPYPVWAPSPPDPLTGDANSEAAHKARAARMWAALLRFGVHIAWARARGRRPVLWMTYVDALFAPVLLRFCRWTGIPLWVLYHGVEIINLQDQHPRLLERVHQQADRFFFNSEATRTLYRERTGKSLEPSQILHPTLDFERLEALEPESLPIDIPDQKIVFSSVCRLVERKGLHRAVRAFRKTKERDELPDAWYLIAGKGAEKERLQRLAGDEEERSIFFLGYISEGQKKALLSRSRGFLHPNYSLRDTDFEGFGISLVEAAWFGCAVLGGDQGGVPEAIEGLSGCQLADMEHEKKAVNQIRRFINMHIEKNKDIEPIEAKKRIKRRLNMKKSIKSISKNGV